MAAHPLIGVRLGVDYFDVRDAVPAGVPVLAVPTVLDGNPLP